MSDKLQLHEIAGYLPYGLRIIEGNTQFEMNGSFLDEWFNWGEPLKGKPILRPMSDLNKPEWASLVEEWDLTYRKPVGWGTDFEIGDTVLHWGLSGNLELFTELYRNHFDIHNLIGRGLAIDINTLTDQK